LKSVSNVSIFNLSRTHLTDLQIKILGLGLKFIPRPIPFNNQFKSLYSSAKVSVTKYIRSIDLNFFFSNKTPDTQPDYFSAIPRIANNSFEVPTNTEWFSMLNFFKKCLLKEASNFLSHSHVIFTDLDALIAKEIRTIKSLNIVIKPADKNLGLTILDPETYFEICIKHLSDSSTYLQIPNTFIENRFNAIWLKLENILRNNRQITSLDNSNIYTKLAKSILQLKGSPLLRIAPFYCLPKLHKSSETLIGRPIVSAPNTITYHASKYLDLLFQPILKKFSTICLSSFNFINEIAELNEKLIIQSDTVILCADIASLYPSIPIDFGLDCFKRLFIKNNLFGISNLEFGLAWDLLNFILNNNYITFNNTLYKQIKGTAMGTPVAVAYSNFVLLEMESMVNSNSIFYKRYIDDLFRICPDASTANDFINSFNDICDSIQLESVTIKRSGIFLDVEVSLDSNNRIITSIFQKLTSKFQYIPPFSAHMTHVFQNWVYNELCRYRIICSIDEDYNKIKYQFLNRLLDRGYTTNFFALVSVNVPSRATLMKRIAPTTLTAKKLNNLSSDKLILIDYLPPISPRLNWKLCISNAYKALSTSNKTSEKLRDLLSLIKKTKVGKKPSKALSHYLVDSKSTKLLNTL
jgi:hypothetical protein